MTHQRPLSPHLQIYKPQMSSVLSITHRATGVALTIGSFMLVWWLVAAALSANAYSLFMNFAGSPLGLFMLFGWSFSLYFHLCNGIRHLFWDMGYLLKMKEANRAGYLVLCVTFILTLSTWVCAFYV